MIELLKELTQNLVLLLLLATFLEMLLPKSDLTKYIRLVVGLFVMLTILQPILQLIDGQGSIALLVKEPPKEQLEEVLAEGQRIQEYHQAKALQATQERLERQLEAMVYLAAEVDSVQVNLTMAAKTEISPEVAYALISVVPKNARTESIKEVERVITNSGLKEQPERSGEVSRELSPADQNLVERVANGISAYLSLDPAKIKVVLKTH